MPVKSVVLATRNEHKVREIHEILGDQPFALVSLSHFPDSPDVEEDGDTLLDNAMKKARTAFRHTGLPCLADDTGLEVDALDGAPGVRSSRFSGESATYEENNQKLLHLLEGVPAEKRGARFRCVVALVSEQGEHWTEGVTEGVILDARRGKQGFGYDPLFFIPGRGKSFAELSAAEKNDISHRGRAFRAMAAYIRSCMKD